MSDDPNEFRVTDIRWVNDLPVPEGYESLPVDSMPGPKLGLIDLGGDSGIIAKVEGNPPVVTPIGEFKTRNSKQRKLGQFKGVPVTDLNEEQRKEFERWMECNLILGYFTYPLFFWTSSRGDHWEKIEADSAETAAIIQAERWNQKGYRGPFTIMVSVSGLEQPPKSGDKVTTFDLVPEVIYRAHKLEFKKLD